MIRNIFRKKTSTLGDDSGDDFDELAINDAASKKQQVLLLGAAGIVVMAGMAYILMPSKSDLEQAAAGKEIKEKTISTDSIVNREMSQQEWMARSEGELNEQSRKIGVLENAQGQVIALEAKVQALESEKMAMQADGTNVLSAYESENQQLRSQLAAAQAQRTAAPAGLYGAQSPPIYQANGGNVGPGAAPSREGVPAATARAPEIKLVAFNGDGGTAVKVEKGSTVYSDSPNYLPPNAIAKARVVVGVDAAAGVRSQTDPLPVVLRITGPARSVYADGKLFRTKVEGCMVNGAAQGDLSSEKVYVKLQRLVCPQPGGRFAVSEVKGFIAFAGKTGVRGRVVSREGGLIGQAFVAGLFGGFGRGFAMNNQSMLQGTSVSVNGERQKLSLGEIAGGGLGEGISTSADSVSKYLIERAEQYQPVVEMPTGIDVEVVFLDGVFIRN